jgi:Protein of unknown function (DUF1329)
VRRSYHVVLATGLVLFLIAAVRGIDAAERPEGIAPGTRITIQNWRQYRQFMPDGMQALFEGRQFWKMPPDVEIDVGPTIIHPLPRGYVEATEKYGSQTRVVELPNDRLTIKDYVAGCPFPNPTEPHKGWKILLNMWYRYIPHLIVATPNNPVTGCTQDQAGNISCMKGSIVYRQLKHNTDPGTPRATPGAGPRDYTEWEMVLKPEEMKYTAWLTIIYTDLTRPEEMYIFRPSLRRVFAVSSNNRCSPVSGSDLTLDDLRYGFNGNVTEFHAKFLRRQRILALTDYQVRGGDFPAGYYMPLGFPKPSWGKWQLRDVDVIELTKVASMAASYCYGKRIMYIDRDMNAPLWEDLYDSHMRLWKIANLSPCVQQVPGVGPQDVSGSLSEEFWDLQNKHASYFYTMDGRGHNVLLNQEVPAQYHNVADYTTPSGLAQIMQ